MKIYNTHILLIGSDGRQNQGGCEEGTGLARIVNGGCGVDLVGSLGDEAFLDEGTDGGDVGVTEGGGLIYGAEDGARDLRGFASVRKNSVKYRYLSRIDREISLFFEPK